MPGQATSRPAGPYAGRTFIILNPAAGSEDAARLRRLVGGAFAARGAPFDLAATEHPGHATELAREAVALGYRAVCVVGGDGTLAEAATAVGGSDVPLAIIPRGTANQLAANLGLPVEMEAAVDVAVAGTPVPFDLGQVNGRAFALVTGAGYDAAVMSAATRPLKERWGFAAYLYAAAKEALSAAPVPFRITRDGETIEVRAITVMIANVGALFASFLPFGFSLAPEPDLSWRDGLLDVLVLAPRSAPEFAGVLWSAARRRFEGGGRMLHFQAREITVEADPPVPMQVDGDPAGTTPLAASVVPGGLRILVPPRLV